MAVFLLGCAGCLLALTGLLRVLWSELVLGSQSNWGDLTGSLGCGLVAVTLAVSGAWLPAAVCLFCALWWLWTWWTEGGDYRTHRRIRKTYRIR